MCYIGGMEKYNFKVVGFFVVYTGFIFAGFNWMLNAKIGPLENLLTNHITETNKKIDKLSDRFDQLYEILLKEKNQK